uniref:Uncharacterized protein n=1 Tax=Catharus ustulatus TaxID=91951 RepID=A0A8C3XXR7_CATUS
MTDFHFYSLQCGRNSKCESELTSSTWGHTMLCMPAASASWKPLLWPWHSQSVLEQRSNLFSRKETILFVPGVHCSLFYWFNEFRMFWFSRQLLWLVLGSGMQ